MGMATSSEAAPPPPPPFNPAEQVGAKAGFRKLRAAELKHGRVAMMASIGAVGQHFIKFPWASGVKGTFGAMAPGEGVVGFLALLIACGPLELAWREDPEKEPGNFGDPFGVKMYNEEMRTKELSNGRMAMII